MQQSLRIIARILCNLSDQVHSTVQKCHRQHAAGLCQATSCDRLMMFFILFLCSYEQKILD